MEFIPVNEPLLNGNEKKYLNECIDTGWISSEGPFVSEFEKRMALLTNRKYAVAVANGTLAIDMAITALDIQEGDEVIMPTFTIISCITQIIRVGAIPVLVDSDLATWNMKVDEIESKINSRTKAIMAVHIYGLPVDMNPILNLAKKYNLKIIEDAAEMHGQTYYNNPCGSFGDISIFSFYPNKHITTGEGGMVLMNDKTLFDKCQSLRNLCFQPPRRFIHHEIGWNMRMTNLQAALGVAQIERIEYFVNKKRSIGKLYNQLLADLSEYFIFPKTELEYAQNIYWVYGLIIKPKFNISAIKMMEELNKEKIGTRPFFYPMHLQPVLKNKGMFKNENLPNSELMGEYGFYIPSGLALTEQQQQQVSVAIHKVSKILFN